MKIKYLFFIILSSCSPQLAGQLPEIANSSGNNSGETQALLPEGVAQSSVQVNSSAMIEQDAECTDSTVCEVEVEL